jgi:hypothetical protein
VRSSTDRQTLATTAIERFGGIDILLNTWCISAMLYVTSTPVGVPRHRREGSTWCCPASFEALCRGCLPAVVRPGC